jgi:hypothetical protein
VRHTAVEKGVHFIGRCDSPDSHKRHEQSVFVLPEVPFNLLFFTAFKGLTEVLVQAVDSGTLRYVDLVAIAKSPSYGTLMRQQPIVLE